MVTDIFINLVTELYHLVLAKGWRCSEAVVFNRGATEHKGLVSVSQGFQWWPVKYISNG